MPDPLGLIGSTQGPAAITPSKAAGGPKDANAPNFKDVLMENINQVNRLQQDAEMAIEDLTTGKRDDVSTVLIAKQKADLAFQMLQQVRNKLVDAYEEIKQMRV